jgi:hypothetical protein
MTEQEQRDLERRRKEDFNFMMLCAAKGNMAMYQLLRDRSLDDAGKPKQGELFPAEDQLKKEQ